MKAKLLHLDKAKKLSAASLLGYIVDLYYDMTREDIEHYNDLVDVYNFKVGKDFLKPVTKRQLQLRNEQETQRLKNRAAVITSRSSVRVIVLDNPKSYLREGREHISDNRFAAAAG